MFRIYIEFSFLRLLLKSEIDRILLLSLLFPCLLVGLRVVYTGSPLFLFLIWNLFLAWLPYCLSRLLELGPSLSRKTWVFVLLCMAWLLLIPNSFYIITDLFHLVRREVPLWFDLALILSFVWNGLLLGILSVRAMEKMVVRRWGLRSDWLFLYPVMWLNAFGIYIGRYLRFNSWDVVTNPYGLAQDVGYLLLHPLRHRVEWSMVFLYAVLMTIIYCTVKKLLANADHADYKSL